MSAINPQNQNPDLVGKDFAVWEKIRRWRLGLESGACRSEVHLSFGEAKITILAPPHCDCGVLSCRQPGSCEKDPEMWRSQPGGGEADAVIMKLRAPHKEPLCVWDPQPPLQV